MASHLTLAAMFVALIALMLTGLPLAFTLGALALVFTIALWGEQALVVTVLQTFDTMRSESLLAIPLYVLMASVLQRSGVIEALYKAMEVWFGRLRGGLAVGTIVICTIMAAMTGIVGAAVAAMGILALPSMLGRGYDEKLALGSICAGGTLGILIPPSVITVVYAVTAQISIGQMFIAGIVPGLVLATLYIVYILVLSWLRPETAPVPERTAQATPWVDRLKVLRALVLPGLIILGVLGSIYFGIATPTEAAAVGVFGALLSALVERKLSFSLVHEAAMDTIRVAAMILWITMAAKAFVAIFTATGGADFLLDFIQGLDANRYVVLAFMMLVLVFLGLFLDEIGIILLCVPVFLPIIKFLGFDPLWFGVLFLVTAQMAYITPPFGYTLFYLKGVLPPRIGMGTVYKAIVPFFVLQLLALVGFVIWPELVTFLPRTMLAR